MDSSTGGPRTSVELPDSLGGRAADGVHDHAEPVGKTAFGARPPGRPPAVADVGLEELAAVQAHVDPGDTGTDQAHDVRPLPLAFAGGAHRLQIDRAGAGSSLWVVGLVFCGLLV